VLEMRYMYLAGVNVAESEAILQKVFDFLAATDMFGTAVTNFAFDRVEGGYTAVEVFPSTAAFEKYAANFKQCRFAVEIVHQRRMVDEVHATIYGSAASLAAAPSIDAFYKTQRRVEGLPDLSRFGAPCFGWRHAPIEAEPGWVTPTTGAESQPPALEAQQDSTPPGKRGSGIANVAS